MERQDYERSLKSGQHVRVAKAVLTYKQTVNIYEIATFGKKDEGIIVITMDLGINKVQGRKIIDLLWDTLKY